MICGSCFVMERFISLWNCRLSSLDIGGESDILLPLPTIVKDRAFPERAVCKCPDERVPVAAQIGGYRQYGSGGSPHRPIGQHGSVRDLDHIESNPSDCFRGFDFDASRKKRLILYTTEGEVSFACLSKE